MDRKGLLAVSALVMAGMFGGGVLAQESVPPRVEVVPGDSGSRELTTIVPQSRARTFGLIQLTTAAANVSITDQIASTHLELTLHNPASRPQEAELVIPVPDGVTVRSFQYDGTGPEPTATLLAKDEARRIYDSIVARTRDPGLLEFAGTNVIRSSVFPVPAGATQKVRIVYEQLLTTEGERLDYLLPRSDSLSAGGPSWTIGVAIKSKRPIATVYSPSHEVTSTRIGPGEFKVDVSERSAALPGSLRLSYLLAKTSGEEPSATLMAWPDPLSTGGNEGFFLMLAGMPDGETGAREAVKREVTIVIDRSGSMEGAKLEQARSAALAVLDGLAMGEAFNIVDYSDSIASFASTAVVKDGKTLEEGRAYIRGLRAGGGTNIHEALMTAVRAEPTAGMLPIVLFLTDGLPTSGITDENAIRNSVKQANAHQRRLFSFGVGFDVNTPLLSGLARAARGKPTFVQPNENVEIKVSDVFRGMKGPVLASPALQVEDVDGRARVSEILPNELPDCFEGDQLVVVGRYRGNEALRINVSGDYFGKPRSFSYSFDIASASPANAFVGRLWATRRIAALTDSIRQRGPGVDASRDPAVKELVDEVVRLSSRFGILTEYTAFLATDPNDRLAVAAPAVEAPSTSSELYRLTSHERSGAKAVKQEVNTGVALASAAPAQLNAMYDDQMNLVELRNVQNVGMLAVIFRNGRWLDSRLLTQEAEEPQQTVEFGTPEYQKIVDALIREGNQGVLTNTGEIYMLVEGQRTLIKQGA